MIILIEMIHGASGFLDPETCHHVYKMETQGDCRGRQWTPCTIFHILQNFTL